MSLENPFNTSTLEKFIDSGSRCKYSPGLYLIATPIGNLEDISLRALYALNHMDILACEDTRVTQKLLQFYGIQKQLISYHDHNWQKTVPQLVDAIKANKTVGYVSDAGMPLISDPGFELVKACQQEKLYVTAIPGPSAPLTALILSGLPCDSFYFDGFLPAKSKARQERLRTLLSHQVTLIFFESPHRLTTTLTELAETYPGLIVSVARELTKLYEEVKTGPIEEIRAYYEARPPKGEIVLLLSPFKHIATSDKDLEERLQTLMQKLTLKDAVAMVAEETGVPKKQVYNIGLQIRQAHTKTKE
jgi:16S rRNA (cytidine1402-2'-O)-methyltransferase